MPDTPKKKEPTASEAMFFFAIVKHTRNKADIDWSAVAAEQGFKNANVAKVRFGQVKRKLGISTSTSTSTGSGAGASSDTPAARTPGRKASSTTTPTKIAKGSGRAGSKGKGRGKGLGVKDEDDEDEYDDDDETVKGVKREYSEELEAQAENFLDGQELEDPF